VGPRAGTPAPWRSAKSPRSDRSGNGSGLPAPKSGPRRCVNTNTNAWDDLSQNDQEGSVGRFKVSGASLDLEDDSADLAKAPAFATEQTNTKVPVVAHIRKANPRGEGDQNRRIFRRGYPLIAGGEGELRRGLIFICFARTISTQFEFIVRGWMRNPDFPTQGAGGDQLFGKLGEQVLGGGYYFVPPLEHKTQPWTWKLPLS
jgi:Dyp-type peroxidase family